MEIGDICCSQSGKFGRFILINEIGLCVYKQKGWICFEPAVELSRRTNVSTKRFISNAVLGYIIGITSCVGFKDDLKIKFPKEIENL